MREIDEVTPPAFPLIWAVDPQMVPANVAPAVVALKLLPLCVNVAGYGVLSSGWLQVFWVLWIVIHQVPGVRVMGAAHAPSLPPPVHEIISSNPKSITPIAKINRCFFLIIPSCVEMSL